MVVNFIEYVEGMSNMDTICRLCGTSEGLKLQIFDPERDYVTKIHQLLPIMVHERDPWSKFICHRCAYKLQEFYDFRELCVKTDTYLKIQVSWKPQTAATFITSQHVPVNPTNVQIKQEETNRPPSTSPPPPQLSPVLPLTLQPQRPLPSAPPVPPVVKLSQDTSARSPVPNNLYTKVHAENLQHTSVMTKGILPITASPNMVFLNSEQGEYFLPEEPEAEASDSSTDDHDAGFPDLGVSEKMAPDTKTETSRTESRKRNNSSSSVQVSKKRKKSPNNLRSHHKNQVNGVKIVFTTVRSEDSSKERSTAHYKPGPKSHVRAQEASISDISNLRSKAKEPEQENKVKHKSGPKSRIADNNDNLDSDNSDVEFVLYKPPNLFLDVIDLTDVVDSSVEGENGSDPKEALGPHVVLTKIPGMCNIYTCSLCEGTFTSTRCANRHMCKVNRLISPTEVEPGEKNPEEKTLGKEASENKVPGEVASENKIEATSEGEAAGQNTTEKNVHECGEGSNDGSTLSENTFSASSKLLSELQRISSETKDAETGNKDNGSETDTSSAGSGLHICDICGFRCTRLASLASHKDRHLYPINEYEEDSFDNVLFNVRKKKKRAPKPVTESE